jgi:hypothetical protein
MSSINKNKDGSVIIRPLDEIISKTIDNIKFIKLDVEGMEIEVLKGSDKILTLYKPDLFIEASTKREFEDLSDFLEKYNYKPIKKFNATPTYLFKANKL